MLSWDDFRHVKAIADRGSLDGAAQALGINHSTVFRRLGQIEQRLGARLFKRSRSGYSLTPAGEEMVRLAERMEQDVASFERGSTASRRRPRPRPAAWCRSKPSWRRAGSNSSRRWSPASCRRRRCAATLGFRSVEVAEGRAVFEGMPEFRHYNPIGTVHGGFAASLLDSALGCAIFSTLAKGEAWTTLELKLNLVRPISKDTGLVRAEGRIIHRGRTVATSRHAEGPRGQALRPRHHDVHDLPGEAAQIKSSASAEARHAADDERASRRSRSGGARTADSRRARCGGGSRNRRSQGPTPRRGSSPGWCG